MKNRHKYRVSALLSRKPILCWYFIAKSGCSHHHHTFLICHPLIIASHWWLNVGTREHGTYDSAVLKNANSVYSVTAVHWRGGEAPNVTLIPFKWHLWSRDIILIYPLNPPFAALFAAITHTFFIICIVFCVNYVDLRSSQGNFFFVEVKWSANNSRLNEGEQLQQSSAPPLPGSQLWWLRAVPSLLLAPTMHNNFLLKIVMSFISAPSFIYYLSITYSCAISIWNNIDNVIAIMQSPIYLRSPQVAVSIDLNSNKLPSEVRSPDLGLRYDISHEWDNWDNWDKPRPAQEDDLRSSCQQPGNKTSEEKLST